ncbi:hypothetical protein NL64_10315 [Pseudomonas fluorescens]|uniref:hypothetical protein n=1 Tax=Pseudomonas fluorescens TaxID=294 RepID=UPI00054C4093|nr:hypothetical protein [Pseudomonas fluorescens]KII32991.1 hypothetical protein NL64_10315 [Pseudomonas fluorescens]
MTKHTELDLNQEQQGPKWADATPDDLEVGLLCALDGETYAERCLIECFLEQMTAGLPYDTSVFTRYITEVFKQTLERTAGKEDATLLLRRGRGRPEDASKIERDFGLSAAVVLLIRDGLGWEAACNDVADRYGVSERQVHRALEKHRDDAEKLIDTELHGLLDGFEG